MSIKIIYPEVRIIDGIEIYSESQILADIPVNHTYTYDQETSFLNDWCKAMDAHYYSVPGDCFSLTNAAHSARRHGKSRVVVNSLS